MDRSRPPIAEPAAPRERFGGSIERITFHSEDTGFCVLRVKAKGHRDLVTVVGAAVSVTLGETVEAYGQWFNDPTYGLQFKAEALQLVPPVTLDGIEKYLASGLLKGIGAHYAKKLVATFGDAVFDIIENTPERLQELPGIGPKRRASLVAAWAEQKAVRDIMVFLQSHGVGTSRAVRIYRTYGDAAIVKVTENPYRLSQDIWGIGFKSADTLAQQLGIPRDSPLRARAGLRHALQVWSEQGHCAAPWDTLVTMTGELLDIPETIILEAIASELEAENLIMDDDTADELFYLVPLYRAETGCADAIQRLLAGPPPWGRIDADKAIAFAEKHTGLALSESQRHAVAKMLGNKVCIVTGGPGVGKTTLVNSILKILQAKKLHIALCAPTGRAAKRMTETTGLEAKTVHRLLEFDPKGFCFRRDDENPLRADLVIVDEASMMDVKLMYSLLQAIPDHAGLLIVGDVDQLPSVGPGAVLADLIASGRVPTLRLTEIFRQAQSSRIIVNAHRINHGELPAPHRPGDDSGDFYYFPAATPEDLFLDLIEIVTADIPARFGFDPVADIQVLTPMNRGALGVQALNLELQKRLNSQGSPKITKYGTSYAPGDKVIQRVNNYTKEVFNGDIGRILAIDTDESLITIDFDSRPVVYDFAELDEIALAYATSIHKSQGSEYPVVVIPLAMQHYMLLERNLLYTAVTRGKQLVILVAEEKALGMAVRNWKAKKRVTRLAERLAAA